MYIGRWKMLLTCFWVKWLFERINGYLLLPGWFIFPLFFIDSLGNRKAGLICWRQKPSPHSISYHYFVLALDDSLHYKLIHVQNLLFINSLSSNKLIIYLCCRSITHIKGYACLSSIDKPTSKASVTGHGSMNNTLSEKCIVHVVKSIAWNISDHICWICSYS